MGDPRILLGPMICGHTVTSLLRNKARTGLGARLECHRRYVMTTPDLDSEDEEDGAFTIVKNAYGTHLSSHL